MCGGRRVIAARSRGGVSPVRTSTRTSGQRRVAARGSRRAAPAGSSGRRWRAPAAARRRGPASRRRAPGPGGAATSIAERNAASVLPEPVGAAISVLRPSRMSGQPSRCGGVGSPSRSANQVRTAGWKSASKLIEVNFNRAPRSSLPNPGRRVLSPATSRADCGATAGRVDQGRAPPPAREVSVRRHPSALHFGLSRTESPGAGGVSLCRSFPSAAITRS